MKQFILKILEPFIGFPYIQKLYIYSIPERWPENPCGTIKYVGFPEYSKVLNDKTFSKNVAIERCKEQFLCIKYTFGKKFNNYLSMHEYLTFTDISHI